MACAADNAVLSQFACYYSTAAATDFASQSSHSPPRRAAFVRLLGINWRIFTTNSIFHWFRQSVRSERDASWVAPAFSREPYHRGVQETSRQSSQPSQTSQTRECSLFTTLHDLSVLISVVWLIWGVLCIQSV